MGRTPCCTRDGVNRGAWTAEEDRILNDYITVHGEGKWRRIPKEAGLNRCGKSCRLRWLNYLRPGIKRGNITIDEEDLIIRLHKLLGNRWSLIAGRLPGRTDNEIKNYWNTNLSKRVPGGKQKPGTKSESSQDQFLVVQKARTAPASPSAEASESSDGFFSGCSFHFNGEMGSDPSFLFDSGLSEYHVPGSAEFGSESNACVRVENRDCGPVVFPAEDAEEINNKWVETELGCLDAFLEAEDWIIYP